MLVASFPLLKGFTRQDLLAGLLIGLCTFGGNALQTAGLQTITSSKSAFITALYVPMVPLLQWVVLKRLPPFMRWVGIVLAFAGLVLLAGPEGQAVGFGTGEMLTLLSAVVISAQIILIGKYAGVVDVRRVTVTQLSAAAILSFVSMPVLGEAVPAFSWQFVFSAGVLGVASIVIALVMNWAQQEVSPTRATLIYSAEPVWAGIFGRIAGERLPAMGLLGAALIVIGVLVSELRPKWSFNAMVKTRGERARTEVEVLSDS
ncbi:EamA-like transporter family protein [compost metagenome]